MPRFIPLSFLTAFAVAAPGCDDIADIVAEYEQATLEPVAVGTRWNHVHGKSDNAWCPIETSGRAHSTELSPGDGEVVVGQEGEFDPGTDPFPCPESHIDYYDGALLFDLSALPAEAANPLLVATLSATRRPTEIDNAGRCVNPVRNIRPAGDPWAPTIDFGDFDIERGPATICEAGADPDSLSCNVNNLVRQWLAGERPNYGMVLMSQRPSPEVDDVEIYSTRIACLFYYGDFRLDVQYRIGGV